MATCLSSKKYKTKTYTHICAQSSRKGLTLIAKLLTQSDWPEGEPGVRVAHGPKSASVGEIRECRSQAILNICFV